MQDFAPLENLTNYIRHKSGGGKIFDDSEVCERSHLSRDSEVSLSSGVWESDIISSRIINSTVTHAEIYQSVIKNTLVSGGRVENSVLACELIEGNAFIKNSHVFGKSRVAHSARLKNVKIRNLTVKGNAELIEWADEFDGHHGYITSGVWTRPPRVFLVSNKITVTESTDKKAFVHCREFPIEHWLRCGNRYGRLRGWTLAEIKTVRKIMHYLKNN